MSLDLFQKESGELLGDLAPVQTAPPGAFDHFTYGTGMAAMRSLAKAGRAVDLLGSIGPIVKDWMTGGTTLQDRYFKEHDDVFNSAVDYWTPKPNEVGVAGEIVGQLLGTLPLLFASPSFMVGQMQMGVGEDLVREGAPAGKAVLAGTGMGAGMGLGVWMPIFGQTLWQRIAYGGIGFNVLQGAAMRGAASVALAGEPTADKFKAFDPAEITLDVLMGAAFGAMAHWIPAQRAEGSKMWESVQNWAKGLDPSDVAAMAVLREAQHLNVDSLPGAPATPADVQAHVERMRTAIDQLERGQPVDVENIKVPAPERTAEPIRPIEDTNQPVHETTGPVPETAAPRDPQFTPDPARQAEAQAASKVMLEEAEAVRQQEGLPPPLEPVNVRATVEKGLLDMGYPADQATANAAIWDAFYRTMGERTGMGAEALYRKYPLDLAGTPSEGMAIGLLQAHDASTFMHESGHFFLEVMSDIAKGPDAPKSIREDVDGLLAWFGKDAANWDNMTLEEKRPFHEQFARGFEQYLREGKAPSQTLRDVFERFRDWLIEVYRSAKNLNIELTDPVRQIMDRMLATKAEHTRAEAPQGPAAVRPSPPPLAGGGEAPGAPSAYDDFLYGTPAREAEPWTPLTAEAPAVRQVLEGMAEHEAGWVTKGGTLAPGRLSEPGRLGEVAFNKWVGKSDWYEAMRKSPNKAMYLSKESDIRRAVQKVIAGDKLKPIEQRTIDYMVDIANERLKGERDLTTPEFNALADEVTREDLLPSTENIVDTDAVARATLIDEARVERAALAAGDDDAAFMAEVRRIIDENARTHIEAQKSSQAGAGQAAGDTGQPARPGAAEPGPGPGTTQPGGPEGRPAGTAAAADPIARAADAALAKNPDMMIRTGTKADGTPILQTIAEYVADARAEADQARRDTNLFEIAADCMLRGE